MNYQLNILFFFVLKLSQTFLSSEFELSFLRLQMQLFLLSSKLFWYTAFLNYNEWLFGYFFNSFHPEIEIRCLYLSGFNCGHYSVDVFKIHLKHISRGCRYTIPHVMKTRLVSFAFFMNSFHLFLFAVFGNCLKSFNHNCLRLQKHLNKYVVILCLCYTQIP